jgi:hypothetical protein
MRASVGSHALTGFSCRPSRMWRPVAAVEGRPSTVESSQVTWYRNTLADYETGAGQPQHVHAAIDVAAAWHAWARKRWGAPNACCCGHVGDGNHVHRRYSGFRGDAWPGLFGAGLEAAQRPSADLGQGALKAGVASRSCAYEERFPVRGAVHRAARGVAPVFVQTDKHVAEGRRHRAVGNQGNPVSHPASVVEPARELGAGANSQLAVGAG